MGSFSFPSAVAPETSGAPCSVAGEAAWHYRLSTSHPLGHCRLSLTTARGCCAGRVCCGGGAAAGRAPCRGAPALRPEGIRVRGRGQGCGVWLRALHLRPARACVQSMMPTVPRVAICQSQVLTEQVHPVPGPRPACLGPAAAASPLDWISRPRSTKSCSESGWSEGPAGWGSCERPRMHGAGRGEQSRAAAAEHCFCPAAGACQACNAPW